MQYDITPKQLGKGKKTPRCGEVYIPEVSYSCRLLIPLSSFYCELIVSSSAAMKFVQFSHFLVNASSFIRSVNGSFSIIEICSTMSFHCLNSEGSFLYQAVVIIQLFYVSV